MLLILTSKQISDITLSSPNLEVTPHLPVLPAAPQEQTVFEVRLQDNRARGVLDYAYAEPRGDPRFYRS